MRLGRMRLRNFKSFEDVRIDFGELAQACVSGDNGAGKSTLIVDGPLWCLFGKLHADLDGIIGPFGDTAIVDVEVFVGDTAYLVSRTRKRGATSGLAVKRLTDEAVSPLVVGVTEAQAFIDKTILKGRSYHELVASVYMVQGEHSTFTKATQAEAKDIFVHLLALDRWLARAEWVRKRRLAVEQEFRSAQAKYEALPSFMAVDMASMERLSGELPRLEAEAEDVMALLAVVDHKLANVADANRLLYDTQERLRDARASLAQTVSALDIARHELEVEDAKPHVMVEYCPTCQQELKSERAIEAVASSIRTKIQDGIARLEQEREKQERAVDGLVQDLTGIREVDAESLQEERESLVTKAAPLKADIRSKQESLASIKAALSMSEQTEAERMRLEPIIDTLSERLESLQLAERAFGRDGIPAYVMDAALPQVEETTNDLLTLMSASALSVRLSTTRLTKTAGEKDVLDILVSDGQTERPFSTYSGGEGFRINFALRVALSELVAQRSGLDLSMLVVDEPEGLDAGGRAALIEALGAVSERFETIILVSHHEDLREALPQHVVVRKGAHGSTVVSGE